MWPEPKQSGFAKSASSQPLACDNMQQCLPIQNARKKFLEEIQKTHTAIVIGETASGKTTQIPQFLFKSGLSKSGLIACTQPRRVAAITIAQRVSQEMGTDVGDKVGYCVRFEDCTSSCTKIKYMTDGMLVRESIGDKLLLKYSYIILDEAHERTVHTDLLFGIVKVAQKVRKHRNLFPLHVIVMSATMDVDHFSQFFNNAPVLYVEGRLYPIALKYTLQEQSDYLSAALVTILQIHQEAPANEDILVFLTGQEEIESMMQTIKDIGLTLPSNLPKLMICPLFAALQYNQQLRAFKQTPAGMRKVVLATNVAETSVTIRGIKYVVDTGKVKAKKFHPSSGLDMLAVQWISQAQAWQRAGRAGRERPGVVYRLYTEDEFEALACSTVPEIQRCSLSNTLLQMMAIGIDDVRNFNFMDPPSKNAISAALEELTVLGAVTNDSGKHYLTSLGKKMSFFPLSPKLSKALVSSADLGCLEQMLPIVSMLSIDSVLNVSHSKREEALESRKKFTASEGDFFMLLNIFRAFRQNKGCKSWCVDNFVNFRNMSTALDIRKQLRELCLKANIAISSNSDMSALRRSIAQGFFTNAAELHPDGSYRSLGSNQVVQIHPSSCLFQCKPAYVIFHELILTTKCYMRDLCVVDPNWLYDAAPDYFRKKLKKQR